MYLITSLALFCVLALSVLATITVRNRLRRLSGSLPDAYQTAAFAAADDPAAPHLIPLAIDLMRKEHCTPAFDALNDAERRTALYAYAVETQPKWVLSGMGLTLRSAEKALFAQLRYIKASQPNHPQMHFGAIKKQLNLRSAPEI